MGRCSIVSHDCKLILGWRDVLTDNILRAPMCKCASSAATMRCLNAPSGPIKLQVLHVLHSRDPCNLVAFSRRVEHQGSGLRVLLKNV